MMTSSLPFTTTSLCEEADAEFNRILDMTPLLEQEDIELMLDEWDERWGYLYC